MPTENRSSNTDPRDVFIRLNPLGLGEAELRKDSTGFEDQRTHSDYLLFLAGYRKTHPEPLQHTEQHQGEPVAWRIPVSGSWFYDTKREACEREYADYRSAFTAEELAEEDTHAPEPLYTHADPGEVERLRAQLAELVSAVRSINFGPAHAIQMRGDDEPCYPQRKEWIEWLLELCEAASVEPSASAGSDPWLPLTAPGQIQVGDWLSFTVAGSFICAKARLIIAPGTTNEEIVYNLKKNHYFCTDMAIDGTSNHKGVLVAKAKP